MQIEQQSNRSAAVALLRAFLNSIFSRKKAMKEECFRDPHSGQSLEWSVGFDSYFAFNPKNPYALASTAYSEWELGFNEAERCAAW
jgi:hypothetical protein